MSARILILATLVATSGLALAQSQPFAPAVRDFIKVDAPVVAITNVRVIDGTGAPAREGQTLVIRDGKIAALAATAAAVPAGATTIDGAGKTVMPGLVMLHEHLYYPTGPQIYGQLGQSFTRLYLAGGVTTMRTGGNVNGVMDITLKQLIDRGQQAGPSIDATAPYLNGPNTFLQMHALKDEADARRQAPGRLLGRHGGDVLQGLHEHHAVAVEGGDRRGPRAHAENHRPSLFGHLRRGGRARNRQPRARLFCLDRLRERQAA
jgi:cytosine/adenosine deaminase-related metal-dependent hydrolase